MNSRRRLLFRDLAAAAAFGSMAVSGELPLWAVVLFGVAFALSLANRRVLERAAPAAALGLLGAAILLYSFVALGRLDLVVASCSFAGLITAHRMLSGPAPATDSQVHLTSLLMLAGGAALSGELSFAACLALFAFFGTLSLGLGVAPRRAMPQLIWGAAFAVAGSAAFFVLFPRLSWNLAARHAARGLGTPVTGFSDRVEVGGGGGSIKTSPRIVLHAQLSPDPGTDTLSTYWVGHAFDAFDGRSWSSSGEARRGRHAVRLRIGNGALITQRIDLLPAYGARTLVALDRPVQFTNATAQGAAGSFRPDLVEMTAREVRFGAPAVSYSYDAFSVPPGELAGPERLLDVSFYKQLPATLDPRMAKLAATAAGDAAANPLAAAHRLETFLKSRYAYTLDLGPPTSDPLATFLFDRRAGHCEYFATALAVLLRTQGIPSRIVAGFYGGERSGDGYIVRAGDAHVWTEALIDGRFVHLDATPESARSGQASAVLAWATAVYEALDTFWRTRVLEYSLKDQVDLASRLVAPPREGQTAATGQPFDRRWLLGLAVLLAGAGALRWARRRGPGPSEATRLREAIDRLTRQARAPSEPLEEALRRLRSARHPLAPALSQATARYLEARFGGAALSREERRTLERLLRQAAGRSAWQA